MLDIAKDKTKSTPNDLYLQNKNNENNENLIQEEEPYLNLNFNKDNINNQIISLDQCKDINITKEKKHQNVQIDIDMNKKVGPKINNILNLNLNYDESNWDDYLYHKKCGNYSDPNFPINKNKNIINKNVRENATNDQIMEPMKANNNMYNPECLCSKNIKSSNEFFNNLEDREDSREDPASYRKPNSFYNIYNPKRDFMTKEEMDVRKMIDYTINPIIKQSIACFSDTIVEGFRQIQEENKQFFSQVLSKLSTQPYLNLNLKPDNLKATKKRETNQFQTQTTEETPRKRKKIEENYQDFNEAQPAFPSNNLPPKNEIIKLIGGNMNTLDEKRKSINSQNVNYEVNFLPRIALENKTSETLRSPKDRKTSPNKDKDSPNSLIKEPKKESKTNLFINSIDPNPQILNTPSFQLKTHNKNLEKLDQTNEGTKNKIIPIKTQNAGNKEGSKIFQEQGLFNINHLNQKVSPENKQEKMQENIFNTNNVFNLQADSHFPKANENQNQNKNESNTFNLFGNVNKASNQILNYNLKEEKTTSLFDNKFPAKDSKEPFAQKASIFTGEANLFNNPKAKNSLEETNKSLNTNQGSLFKYNNNVNEINENPFLSHSLPKLESKTLVKEALPNYQIPNPAKDEKNSGQVKIIEAEQAVLKDLAKRNNPDKAQNILFEDIKERSNLFMNNTDINIQNNSPIFPSNLFNNFNQLGSKEPSNANFFSNAAPSSLFGDTTKKLSQPNIFSNSPKKEDQNKNENSQDFQSNVNKIESGMTESMK